MVNHENVFEDPELQAFMKQHGIVHQPGSADALMREIKPLLLADGIDLDDPAPDFTLDQLNEAIARAVDYRNAMLFIPNDAERARSLQMLYEFTHAFIEGGSEAASRVLDTVKPDPTASRPAASHLIGTGLGLIDTWYTDTTLATGLRNVPVGTWRGKIRKIATDLQSLARSGRAFDSHGSFITRHGGADLSLGIALLVASTVIAVAKRDESTPTETFTRLTGYDPLTPAQGSGAAFGLGRNTDATHEAIQEFAEWLTLTDADNSAYVDAATEMLAQVQQFASAHSLSLNDADDIPDIIDVLDGLTEGPLRDDGLDVLLDYVTFQARNHTFGEDWEPLIGLVDDAIMSNDPVHLVLDYALETTFEAGFEALDSALYATTVVHGVKDFMAWLGKSQPVTGTGVLRRADINTVAAMIGVAAEGVAKAPPVDHALYDHDDPQQPLPAPSVWQVRSMREVTPLNAWWEALKAVEIIDVTTSRVRPGPAIAQDVVGNTPDAALAAELCTNYITQVLVDDVLDEAQPLFLAAARAACEVAVDLLLHAIAPEGVPAVHIAPESRLHTIVRSRALHSIQLLADANILVLEDGKVSAAPAMHGIISDAVHVTLRMLEIVQYINTLSQD